MYYLLGWAKKFLDSRDPAASVLRKFMIFFYIKIFYHVTLYTEWSICQNELNVFDHMK